MRQQLSFWKDLVWSLTAGRARDWLAAHATSWETYEGVSRHSLKSVRRIIGASVNAQPLGNQANSFGDLPSAHAPVVARKAFQKDFTIAGSVAVN